jgi:hypothetical protein
MEPETLLLIFGFGSSASASDVSEFLGAGRSAVVRMVSVPGGHDEAIAVVQISAHWSGLFGIAEQLRVRHFRGCRLRPWIPAMNWS